MNLIDKRKLQRLILIMLFADSKKATLKREWLTNPTK